MLCPVAALRSAVPGLDDVVVLIAGRGSTEARVDGVEAVAHTVDRRRHVELGIRDRRDVGGRLQVVREPEDGDQVRAVLDDVEELPVEQQSVTVGQVVGPDRDRLRNAIRWVDQSATSAAISFRMVNPLGRGCLSPSTRFPRGADLRAAQARARASGC